MHHFWSQVWIEFWSFREAVVGSLSDTRIAVSSAKVAVVVAGEVGRSGRTDSSRRRNITVCDPQTH
jgi:hypothetical protein